MNRWLPLLIWVYCLGVLFSNGVLLAVQDNQLSGIVKIVSLLPVGVGLVLLILRWVRPIKLYDYLIFFIVSFAVTCFTIGFTMNDVVIRGTHYDFFHTMVTGNYPSLLVDAVIIFYLIRKIKEKIFYATGQT